MSRSPLYDFDTYMINLLEKEIEKLKAKRQKIQEKLDKKNSVVSEIIKGREAFNDSSLDKKLELAKREKELFKFGKQYTFEKEQKDWEKVCSIDLLIGDLKNELFRRTRK